MSMQLAIQGPPGPQGPPGDGVQDIELRYLQGILQYRLKRDGEWSAWIPVPIAVIA